MIIARQKEFARKKRRRLKDNPEVEAKIVNGCIIDSQVDDPSTKRALVEDDLSKIDNTGIYHGDRKLKDEDKLTAKDKEKVRKAVNKGQMYIEFEQ